MRPLNFPMYSFRFKSSENAISIFDIARKKFVILQPEEWVRQNVLHYLVHTKAYPKSLISVERQLTINKVKKRYDIVVHNSMGRVEILVECKAPDITIDQTVFNQIAKYNYQLDATYLMLTNGLEHYHCKMDFENKKYTFLKEIPDFHR